MIIDDQIIGLWMFCAVQKPYLLILANLQSNKRLKKETLQFSLPFFVYMHLSKRQIFDSYKILESFSHFHLSRSIMLYKELGNVGLFSQVTV